MPLTSTAGALPPCGDAAAPAIGVSPFNMRCSQRNSGDAKLANLIARSEICEAMAEPIAGASSRRVREARISLCALDAKEVAFMRLLIPTSAKWMLHSTAADGFDKLVLGGTIDVEP